MRQCIFVVGSRKHLQELVPLLRLARDSGLRHSVWITAEQHEPVELILAGTDVRGSVVIPDRSAPRSRLMKMLYWLPVTVYRLYNYVHGVKIWTTKSPLVVVHGDDQTSRLAAFAGRWGGGQLVYLQHTAASTPAGHRMLRKSRFVFCGAEQLQAIASRYPGSTIVGVDSDDSAGRQLIIDSLLRWTGGKSTSA